METERGAPGLPVFVYGTLKRGLANHATYLGGARFLGEARLRGRLWVHEDGIPVMLADPERIRGLAWPEDLGTWLTTYRSRPELRDRDLGPVHGELFALTGGSEALTRLDALEGFEPGLPSWYLRVEVEVDGAVGPVRAWVYLAGPFEPDARELPGGVYRGAA